MIRNLVDRFLGGVIEARVEARVEALREAAGRQTEDVSWRRLTDTARELPPMTGDRMREIAAYLWTHNPLARRIINLIGEWVVGEGVTFRTADPRAQAYLERHWRSPGARWNRRLEQRVRELYLFGDQTWPIFANPFNGLFTVGVIDPSRIKHVVLDPEYAQLPIGVITKQTHAVPERRIRTVLLEGERGVISAAAERERERFTDGECFFNAVNNLSNSARGISELFALADAIDGYEQLLFSILRQELGRSQYMWDLTLTGADQKAIDEKLKTIQAPKPFSVRVHNEKETWALVGPDKGAAAANAETARLQRNHVLGGAQYPEHWYGGGGDVNRAVGAEMQAPTEKAMTAKQRTVEYIMEDVLTAQVERGIETGAVRDSEEAREITVSTPDLSTRDLSRIGTALSQVAAALAQGGDEGWVDDETSTRVMGNLIGQMGVKVDPEEMLERAREEAGRGLADEASRALERRLAAAG
ncbi:MAG TPA: hypothetical protein VF615_25610 [Longimicrobiaceae bacterium]|jgi:hypothetical protein